MEMRQFSKVAMAAMIVVGSAACSSEAGPSLPVTEDRIEAALTANGFHPLMADCMAERLTDGLNNEQLLEIEAMAPESEGSQVAVSNRDALKRLEHGDDKNALLLSHARCKISIATEHQRGF